MSLLLSFSDILKDLERRQEKKVLDKIPSLQGIKVPTELALEQCSSEATALHKASLAVRFAEGDTRKTGIRVADLTGGLGVDCWAFSRHSDAVYYNEMNPDLAKVAEENFAAMGISGVEFHNETVEAGNDRWKASLAGFRPDIIYLDPARRDGAGKKVFLLEECSPNVLELMPDLLSISPKLMIKLSPMADISLIVKRLSERCLAASGSFGIRSVHVVGFDGECKELLCLVDRDWRGPCDIVTEELSRQSSYTGTLGDKASVRIAGNLLPGEFFLIPTASAMKSGCHEQICAEAGIAKLDRFTNIYKAGEAEIGQLGPNRGFFRIYAVEEILPLSNASIKDLGGRYPEADVSARNIPMTSEELQARLAGGKSRRNAESSSQAVQIIGFSTPHGRFLARLSPLPDKQTSSNI